VYLPRSGRYTHKPKPVELYSKKQVMDKNQMCLKIIFRDILVGSMNNVANDMWYMFGNWVPEKNEVADEFTQLMKAQNLKRNFSETKGKYVQWAKCDRAEKQNGIAMGLDDEGYLTVRMITTKELLEAVKQDEEYR